MAKSSSESAKSSNRQPKDVVTPPSEVQPQVPQRARLLASNEPPKEIFSDGVIGISMRSGIAKLELYSVVGAEDQGRTELRRVTQRLVLPVSALNEIAALLRQMSANLAAVRQNGEQPLASPLT